MSYARISRIEGVVASRIDDRWFTVRLGDGRALAARVSRRLGLLQKRHTIGDRVLVGMLAQAAEGLILTRGSRATPGSPAPHGGPERSRS